MEQTIEIAQRDFTGLCFVNLVDFDIAVRTVPQYYEESPKMISQGPSVCIFNKEDNGEVLASWLFTQYLLTDGIQMAYSKTEGYLPVTETAINSPEYLDYLSRGGEDNDLYYSVKIDAARLSELLGCPVLETVSTSARGLDKVVETAAELVGKEQVALYRQADIDLTDKAFWRGALQTIADQIDLFCQLVEA